MKFNFTGQIDEIKEGMEILSKRLGFEINPTGIEIKVTKRLGSLEVKQCGEVIEINYEKKIHFFRALGLMIENHGENFSITEKSNFKTNGIMIDASRNAVMRVEKIKDFIEIMALMGLDLIMMYTEDTYEVEGYPYFGYMRGRYTYGELHECDDYADIFGIEMIPCIQTLGHSAMALKWNHGISIGDTANILLVGEDDTYKFIKDIMIAATKPFRSNKIHLGMDEARTLGLGNYLKKNGYKEPHKIMREHLVKVKEIADELELEPIIWGDMFVAQRSKKSDCYDMKIDIPEKAHEEVPDGMKIVYWDYYHENQDEYDKLIKIYKHFDEHLMFAGGIWTWGRMNVNHRKTIASTIPALRACVENGVEEVFATMWGDNGNQTNIYEALYGMQIYAEIGYGYDYDTEHLEKRFRVCTGEEAKGVLDLELVDDFNLKPMFVTAPNPSEFLLWQDPLIGFFDKHIPENISEKYSELARVYEKDKENSVLLRDIFEYSKVLCEVLEIKSDLGVRLKKHYDEKNNEMLKNISMNDIPELIERLKRFKCIFRALWLSTYKSFGWESIDMRFGALVSRLETTKEIVEQYVDNEIEKIEELEEEKLYFCLAGRGKKKDLSIGGIDYSGYIKVSI